MRGLQGRQQRTQTDRCFLVVDGVEPGEDQIVVREADIQAGSQPHGAGVAGRVLAFGEPQSHGTFRLVRRRAAFGQQCIKRGFCCCIVASVVGDVGQQAPVRGIKRASNLRLRRPQRPQRQRQLRPAQVQPGQAHGVVLVQLRSPQGFKQGNCLVRLACPVQQLRLKTGPACGDRPPGWRFVAQSEDKIQGTLNRPETFIHGDDLGRFFFCQGSLACERQPGSQQCIVVVQHGAEPENTGQSPFAGPAFHQRQPGLQGLRRHAGPLGRLRLAFQPDGAVRLCQQGNLGNFQGVQQITCSGKSVPRKLKLLGAQILGQHGHVGVGCDQLPQDQACFLWFTRA